uniref:Uncharacterized protein n=1 Tax=Vespula pensylvanica TaxID=30213 RepID=A0A834PBY2_VESPE|nr:hypothetical protein H0235_003690 [Vespula pensylvanica]
MSEIQQVLIRKHNGKNALRFNGKRMAKVAFRARGVAPFAARVPYLGHCEPYIDPMMPIAQSKTSHRGNPIGRGKLLRTIDPSPLLWWMSPPITIQIARNCQ